MGLGDDRIGQQREGRGRSILRHELGGGEARSRGSRRQRSCASGVLNVLESRKKLVDSWRQIYTLLIPKLDIAMPTATDS